MRYLYTKSDHYKKFIRESGSNRISKGLKILPESDKMNLFKISLDYKINEELFETPIETKYSVIKINDKFYKIIFHSNSGTQYRLDIHEIKEKIGAVNHLSFTEEDSKFDRIPSNKEEYEIMNNDYNRSTNKHEMIEIMRRMNFILKDLIGKNIILNSFCIGGTELQEKNNIYEYFLKVIVGDDGFKKLDTYVYPKTGWGLYFSV